MKKKIHIKDGDELEVSLDLFIFLQCLQSRQSFLNGNCIVQYLSVGDYV